MDFCLGVPAADCLYNDHSTSCSYSNYHGTNFKPIPESVLTSIQSSNNCTWLRDIIAKDYTTQDVWRDLLPTTIYNPNFTNCYGEQYLDFSNQSAVGDRGYSYHRGWLIPRGLASLADSCLVEVCRGTGATGSPDMIGIGMVSAYAFELFFITVFYLSRLIGPGTRGEAYDDTTRICQCFAVTTHVCTGSSGECECSAAMIRRGRCDPPHERGRSMFEVHDRAMRETTPSFLDTAIFFALSVAIGMIATDFSHQITNYEERVLAYLSIVIASPLYTVLAFSIETLRRRRLRRNLTSLAVILLCVGLLAQEFAVGVRRDRWGAICFEDNIRFMTARTIMALIIGVFFFACELCRLLLWPIQLAAEPYRGFYTEMSAENPWGEQTERSCWQSVLSFSKRYIYNWESQKRSIWVVATFSLLFTFFAGGHLAAHRIRMQRLAGESYKESEMTYGQYLAALIWGPVLVEYVYHVTLGTRKALKTRLPTYYTAARLPAPITAVVVHSSEAGGGGSGEEIELGRTSNAGGSLLSHPGPGGAYDQRHTVPVV